MAGPALGECCDTPLHLNGFLLELRVANPRMARGSLLKTGRPPSFSIVVISLTGEAKLFLISGLGVICIDIKYLLVDFSVAVGLVCEL